MRTLILNGSPKRNGDVTALLDELIRHIEGEVRVISCFDDIAPCSDCRYCWKHSGCAINDRMQEIYPYFESCDNIVVASPVWFSSLSGPTLDLASRFQTYFAGRFFRGEKRKADKNGVLILAGAEKGTEEMPEKAALVIMKAMSVRRPITASVYSMNTDKLPAAEDQEALRQVREAAQKLNELYRCKEKEDSAL